MNDLEFLQQENDKLLRSLKYYSECGGCFYKNNDNEKCNSCINLSNWCWSNIIFDIGKDTCYFCKSFDKNEKLLYNDSIGSYIHESCAKNKIKQYLMIFFGIIILLLIIFK